MTVRTRLWPLLLALLPLQPLHAADERCAERCAELGECAPEQGGGCVAAFDEDCQASDACTKHGRCSADDGVCRATSSADCAASQQCARRGECTLLDGHCEVTSDTDCQASALCRNDGRCTHVDQVCEARAAADCAASAACKATGACGLANGRCVPTDEAHCAASLACTDEDRCQLEGIACIVGASDPLDPADPVDPADPEPTATAERPFTLEGPLRRNAVRPILREVRPKAKACGPLTAEVELTATVSPKGKPENIAVIGVPRKQEKCIAKALKKRRFPERQRSTRLIWRLHRADLGE